MENLLPEAVYVPEDQRDFSEASDGEFEWCLHCERALPAGYRRILTDVHPSANQYCPYSDCPGGSAIDIMPWKITEGNSFTEELNERYGDTPQVGVVYTLSS